MRRHAKITVNLESNYTAKMELHFELMYFMSDEYKPSFTKQAKWSWASHSDNTPSFPSDSEDPRLSLNLKYLHFRNSSIVLSVISVLLHFLL